MKSFSKAVKEELSKINPQNCCAKAELLALLLFCGRLSAKEITFAAENEALASRLRLLFVSVFNLTLPENELSVTGKASVENILLSLRIISHENKAFIRRHADGFFLKRDCCRKGFVRGAFLAAGNVTDPEKSYHFEFSTHYLGLHRELYALLEGAGFPFKNTLRKSNHILYLKDSELIGDMLAFVGGYRQQMAFLNAKIEKELRNDLNRSLNCTTANMGKTISAAARQISAVEKIERFGALESLNGELREIADLRLKNPDLTITELGRLLSPPLTKSGINHRIRKLMKIAEEL